MLTKEMIKSKARELGADLVGIGDISLFEGTKPEKDPRFIAPGAKRVIALGFRVLRGCLRGSEEGTHFFQYPEMGVVNIDEVYAPIMIRKLGCFIEDNGYEAVLLRNEPDRRPGADKGNNPERRLTMKLNYAIPVSSDRPAPDVLMDFNQAAYICGLGEIGKGGFFLTPEFGPLQRFAFILTDAKLEADGIYDGPSLCDECGACMEACPASAIDTKLAETKTWAGNQITCATLDEWQCSAGQAGAIPSTNPFLSKEDVQELVKIAPDGHFDEKKYLAAIKITQSRYPGVRFDYQACICGRHCWRACMLHMEEKGLKKKTFINEFRTNPLWSVEY